MKSGNEGNLRSHDGTVLYYCSEGEGLPLITCNGILCSLGYWVYFRPYFRKHHRVICWDYPGHGRSGQPAHPSHVTISSYCQDLKIIMDALDVTKAVLVGHSMGVQVILEFYKQYQDRVAGLIPICGTYGHPFRTFYGKDWMEKVYPYVLNFGHDHAKGFETIFKPLLRTRLAVPIARLTGAIHWYLCPTGIMNDYFHQIAGMDFEHGFRALMAMAEHTAYDVLPSIRVPTLIVAGAKDPFTPVWIAEEMWRMIPGAELFIIPQGTHTALVEDPIRMHRRIEVFLRDHFVHERSVASRRARMTPGAGRILGTRSSKKKIPQIA